MEKETPPETENPASKPPPEKLILPDLALAFSEFRTEVKGALAEFREFLQKPPSPPPPPPAPPAAGAGGAETKPWWDISDVFGG